MTTEQQVPKVKSPNRALWLLLVASFSVVLLLWAGSWWYLTTCYSAFTSWGERGSFGDMFGAVNSLFAALALAFVIITLYLQIRSIREARRNAEEEKFQDIFFRLLDLQQNVLAGIERFRMVNGTPIRLSGRRVFSSFYDELARQFKASYKAKPHEDQLLLINKSYLAFYEHEQSNVGHYFRALYNIVKFIDGASIAKKQMYTNLLRGQLSSNELLVLFYNCLSEKGITRFKPLVETYALLENMPEKELLSDKFNLSINHRSFYKESAFRESTDIRK